MLWVLVAFAVLLLMGMPVAFAIGLSSIATILAADPTYQKAVYIDQKWMHPKLLLALLMAGPISLNTESVMTRSSNAFRMLRRVTVSFLTVWARTLST